jgi:hypothetical protein
MKKKTVGFAFAAAATALSMTACTTVTSQPKHSATAISEAQTQLHTCLSRQGLRAAVNDCVWTGSRLYPLGDEGLNEAEAHWESLLEAGGPDYFLMGATLRSSESLITEALANGADPNMEMTLKKAYGHEPGTGNITPLAAALGALRLDDAAQLMAAGANPNWRDPSDPNKDVAFDVQLGKRVIRGDNSFNAWDAMNLLMQQDYQPSGETLFSWYREVYLKDWLDDPEIKETYLALRDRAKPEDVQVLAQLIKEGEEEVRDRQAKREQRNAAAAQEREQSRARLEEMQAQLAADELQRTQHMRHIGAKICQDAFTRIGNIIRIGYVERLAESKAQIRVAHAHLRGAPTLSPGGFRPEIIWDHLSKWYLCE